MPEEQSTSVGSLSSLFHKLYVRSALNPMLWLCGLGVILCCIAPYAFKDYPFLLTLLVIVGLIPIVTTCAMAVFFMIKAPDKLQSEDFQLRRQSLQIIQKNRGHTELIADTIVAISNPAAPKRLTEGEQR